MIRATLSERTARSIVLARSKPRPATFRESPAGKHANRESGFVAWSREPKDYRRTRWTHFTGSDSNVLGFIPAFIVGSGEMLCYR
jgi:hypothetical protein